MYVWGEGEKICEFLIYERDIVEGIRWLKEAVILEYPEMDHSRSTASRYPNAPSLESATSGPGCPWDGQALAWARVQLSRSVPCPDGGQSDLGILQLESPPKSQGPFWAIFLLFGMALGCVPVVPVWMGIWQVVCGRSWNTAHQDRHLKKVESSVLLFDFFRMLPDGFQWCQSHNIVHGGQDPSKQVLWSKCYW